MPRIFICYRREDTSGHAGRLRDALSARFGSGEIFRDFETIGPGDDFVQAMSRAIGSCQVFLAIIGNQWLSMTNPDGARRLDDPDDHVRREIVEALGRGVRLIPILVEGAEMPRPTELPEPLKPLATRNAFTLDDEGWESDVERLAAAIRPDAERGPDVALKSLQLYPSRRPFVIVLAAAVALAAIAALVYNGTKRAEERSIDSTARPAAVEAAPGAGAAPTGRVTPVTLPAGGEAELGEGVFEILDAGVQPHTGGSTLTLRIRLTNRSRYDAGLFAESFRVLVNAEATAPTNALGEVVPAETAKDATLTFELPPNTGTATLRISAVNETADVPLDLSGRTGATPEQDREKRRAGGTTSEVRIDPARADLRFDALKCELRSAVVRRYAHKLTLTLHVRAQNGGRYATDVGNGHFRLVVEGIARPPADNFMVIVEPEATADVQVAFDLPLEARAVVLRARFGESVAEVPIQIRD